MPITDAVARCELLRWVRDHPEIFSCQGAVVPSWRTYAGHRLGPFYRLAFRVGGRQRSVYLGRDQALADAVRRLLAELQAPVRASRQLDRELTQLRAEVQAHQRTFDEELAQQGLVRKGREIRGWRRQLRRAPTAGADDRSSLQT